MARRLGIVAAALIAVVLAVSTTGAAGPAATAIGNLEDEVTALRADLGALESRVDALEATPAPTPTPTPTPEPCPADLQAAIDDAGDTLDLTGCSYVEGATIDAPLTLIGATIRPAAGETALRVTADDVTIERVTIEGPQSQTWNAAENGVSVVASAADPVRRLVIRDSVIGNLGGRGIHLIHVADTTISGTHVHDIVYAGIMVLSGRGGTIEGNTVERIGVVGSEANSGNAYGIVLTRVATSDFAANPVSADYLVTANTVTDVPTWHGLDTHGGLRITFADNTVRRTSRAVFLTSAVAKSTEIVVDGNTILESSLINDIAVTLVSTVDSQVINNAIGDSYPPPHVYDYQGNSTGLVVSGNTVVNE